MLRLVLLVMFFDLRSISTIILCATIRTDLVGVIWEKGFADTTSVFTAQDILLQPVQFVVERLNLRRGIHSGMDSRERIATLDQRRIGWNLRSRRRLLVLLLVIGRARIVVHVRHVDLLNPVSLTCTVVKVHIGCKK